MLENSRKAGQLWASQKVHDSMKTVRLNYPVMHARSKTTKYLQFSFASHNMRSTTGRCGIWCWSTMLVCCNIRLANTVASVLYGDLELIGPNLLAGHSTRRHTYPIITFKTHTQPPNLQARRLPLHNTLHTLRVTYRVPMKEYWYWNFKQFNGFENSYAQELASNTQQKKIDEWKA
jgi:hypothetical protein